MLLASVLVKFGVEIHARAVTLGYALVLRLE